MEQYLSLELKIVKCLQISTISMFFFPAEMVFFKEKSAYSMGQSFNGTLTPSLLLVIVPSVIALKGEAWVLHGEFLLLYHLRCFWLGWVYCWFSYS